MRILGIDLARAIAVFGMVVVNFKMVLGSKGQDSVKAWMQLLDGKFAALFVILAGIGLALMTKKAQRHNTPILWQQVRLKIIKRALFLLIFGLLYWWIWPADILHFYGVYMLLTLLLLQKKDRFLLWSCGSLIALFPLLLFLLDYEAGWNFDSLDYADFWQWNGFLRNLFFNGFHPVIPWAAFMIYGLWLGRQDLQNTSWLKKVGCWSFLLFLFLQLLSYGVPLLFSDSLQDILHLCLGTDPMPPMPLYMWSGMASSTALIAFCILLGQAFPSSKIVHFLIQTGKLALTLYMLHILIGIVLIETAFNTALGNFSWQFSLLAAFCFNLFSIFFANLWLHFFSQGPFEALMRRICG